MKTIVLAITALVASLESSAQIESGVLEGRVLSPGTEEGIPSVQVTLDIISVSRSPEVPRPARGALDLLRPVMTDARGYFVFRNLFPGRYTVRAQREGYLGPELPTTGWYSPNSSYTTTIISGRRTSEIKLFLQKGGTISGRIFTPSGSAAPEAMVTAYRRAYNSNGRVILAMFSSRRTNERGEYRFSGVPPGAYLIAAKPPDRIDTPKSASSTFTTFYPGEFDGRDAIPIIVGQGNDVSSINISLRIASVVSIFGTVDTNVLRGGIKPSFYVVPRNPNDLSDDGSLKPVEILVNRLSGKFEIPKVRPGYYDLIVAVPLVGKSGATSLFPTRMPLDVGDQDLEGVKVVTASTLTVSARLVVDGDTSIMKGVSLRLRSKESFPALFDSALSFEASRDTSGTFVFPRVPPGLYTFEVTGLPPTGYVKYLLPGSIEDGFRVPEQAAGPIVVFISSQGESLKGIVRNTVQQAVANATIVLIPLGRQQTHRYKTAISDRNGNFILNGIAPGQYELFSWEQIPSNAWMNSEFMSTFAAKGVAVTIGDGSVSNPVLTVLRATSDR